VIKNIGKLKQWTGEKFGSAKSTSQTEDFQRLEVETDRKRAAFEKLHTSILLLQSQLKKVKISPEDNKTKRPPHDVFGVCLNLYGNEFNEDSPLGIATINVGQAQSRLAAYQEEFADSVGMSYIEKLDEGMALYKDYQNLKKKLESRRLDLDAKLNRLQKSKKEKPELEQEMQAAKMKYEDTEYDLIQKMVALQDFEDEHCAVLRHLLDLQCEYLSRSLETLNEVRDNWTQPLVPRSQNNGGNSNSLRRTSTMAQSAASIPDTDNTKNRRKAIFEFGGESADELSFRKGDIITVVEEVDEGWWLGEITEANGMIRRGIFPVNYTEAVSKINNGSNGGPPMPARPNLRARSSSNSTQPLSSSSSLQQHAYIPEEEEEEQHETGGYEDEVEETSHNPSPFGDSNRTSSSSASDNNNRGFSYIRPNNDNEGQPTNTLPPSKPTYKMNRIPPPPPASRTRSNSSVRGPPPPMPLRSST
ncbi:hypothetical protein BDF20DRAFT_801388, partial [Mycotypha africana]|uniref:uncharacterized protein n=1 Tax=Mycotypha africana TaxID=64632 RepID=UPI002301712F